MKLLTRLLPLLTATGIIAGCNTLNSTPETAAESASQPIPETVEPMDETARVLADAVRDGTLNLDSDNLPEGTDVVIRSGEKKEIQEFRINGFLYAIKVTPKVGKPYFLVAVDSQGNFIRADQPQMLIPSWRIMEW